MQVNPNNSHLPADIQYLCDDKISSVLSEGLDVLYRTQPKQPIDFFAKWLLNYEATKKNEQAVYDADKKKKEVLKRYDELAEVRKQKEAKEEDVRKLREKAETNFREKVQNHNYHEELLVNDLPLFLEKEKRLPAVYVGILEHPTRAVGDDEDEEYAHLNTAQPKIISYIGASGTQKFLLGRELPLETGVTYSILKDEQPPVEGAEGEEVAPRKQTNYIYVPDVTKEPKIHFFRIPKLGSYLACKLSYKSVLSERSFNLGVTARQKYQAEIEAQNQEKIKRDEEYAAKIEEAKEQEVGEEAIQAIEEEWKNFEWPEFVEREFDSEERKFVLCVDTLGQNRDISEQEIKYVSELAEYFVKSWEESEKRQLSQDIDLYIATQKTIDKEEYLEELTNKLTEEIEYLTQEEEEQPEQDDLLMRYKKAVIATDFYRGKLLEEDIKNLVKKVTEYRVVKFTALIQNVMYFLGYKKGQVNIPGTNVLEWKEVKKIFATDNFFKKLEEYEFRGSKEGYWEKYAFTNVILQKLDKIKVEDLEDYNLGLAILYRFVKQLLETRLLDIQVRKFEKEENNKKREELLVEAETLAATREKELEEAQAKAAENEEELNLEEWNAKWEEEHPPIEIPDFLNQSIDQDIEE